MVEEYISKQAFNDAIREAVRMCPTTFYNGLEVARQIAHNMDAADVAPVVRCKYCLSWKKDAYGGICDRYGVRLDKDWFCAGGEKREAQYDD